MQPGMLHSYLTHTELLAYNHLDHHLRLAAAAAAAGVVLVQWRHLRVSSQQPLRLRQVLPARNRLRQRRVRPLDAQVCLQPGPRPSRTFLYHPPCTASSGRTCGTANRWYYTCSPRRNSGNTAAARNGPAGSRAGDLCARSEYSRDLASSWCHSSRGHFSGHGHTPWGHTNHSRDTGSTWGESVCHSLLIASRSLRQSRVCTVYLLLLLRPTWGE
jgi:hypothetical protein